MSSQVTKDTRQVAESFPAESIPAVSLLQEDRPVENQPAEAFPQPEPFKGTVALFATCINDVMYPETCIAA